jgi:hypothetical protein
VTDGIITMMRSTVSVPRAVCQQLTVRLSQDVITLQLRVIRAEILRAMATANLTKRV